jgi:hypothetical protein
MVRGVGNCAIDQHLTTSALYSSITIRSMIWAIFLGLALSLPWRRERTVKSFRLIRLAFFEGSLNMEKSVRESSSDLSCWLS